MARKMILLAVAFVAFFATPAAAQYTPTTGGGTGGTGVQQPPAPGGVGGTGALPRTGADDSTRTIAMVGAGLLGAGGIVLLSIRRRQVAT